jgi:hypothetical protein
METPIFFRGSGAENSKRIAAAAISSRAADLLQLLQEACAWLALNTPQVTPY